VSGSEVEDAVAPRRLFDEWPLILVLTGVLAGLLVVVLLDRFRRGTVLMGASVIMGMWLRAFLPEDRAGLLRVRRKWIDVLTLGVLGAGLTILALIVPQPPV